MRVLAWLIQKYLKGALRGNIGPAYKAQSSYQIQGVPCGKVAAISQNTQQ